MDKNHSEDTPIRGEVRLVGYRRVSFGLFLECREGLTADEERLRDLHALLLVLPGSAVYTHLTAAWLYGWRLPKLPDQVPVFAAADVADPRPRRPGLICSRITRKRKRRMRRGLPVDEPEEVLLRLARDLGLLDLLIVLDSAIRNKDVDARRMEAVLASRRPGVRMLREAWRRADRRSESAGETVLRTFHEAMDVPVQPQVDIFDEAGRHLGRADLVVVGKPWLHEYDGDHHRGKDQRTVDLRRDRGFAGTSYVRRGFVLDDLLNHAAVVMHELDRALDRPHDVRRLRRWKALVANSLYSDAGRDRLLNRWRRRNGLLDWIGAA